METKKWNLDLMHSELQFKVKHMMVSNVTGNIRDFKVEVETQGDELEDASISFEASLDSIATGQSKRDAHLKGPDFFNTPQHPKMTFTSTAFKKLNEEGDYELSGDLTIRGVSRPVKLNVNHGGTVRGDAFGLTRAGFSLSGKINRKDWGLDYNAVLETGGVMVSDEVRIIAELALILASEN